LRQRSLPARAGFLGGLAVGAVVVFLLLFLIGPLRDAVLPDRDGGRVDQALQAISKDYFRKTDPDQLDNSSIEGAVRRLRSEYDDRFSHYFDAETFKRFDAATEGEFAGVGMTVTEVPRGLRVAHVFADTPAEGAGIGVGDVITAVDGRSLAGESATEASARIKGPVGTEVELTVRPKGGGPDRAVTLERANVRVPAVVGRMLRKNGKKVGYVALATFSRGAHGELRDEVERLYDRGAEGLVLDLRGNGGGLLQEAILVTSIFLEDGPVVITEGRNRPRHVYDATGGALPPKPLVVLTNRDTASASEIVAAALQENDLATVVGTRTYGKGTFQEVIELDGGGALDLTVGEYLTADGSSILGSGVQPDVRAPDHDFSDGDDTLERGLGLIAGQTDAG
jgi:carboxyl-terminal processing protease